jgi:hypothetical protein
MFHNVFQKSCRFWVYVEKYSRDSQDTDYNNILRMHCACWVNKATDWDLQCVTVTSFPRQTLLRMCASVLRSYVMLKRKRFILSCCIFYCIIQILCRFGTNHFCNFWVMELYTWMLHLKYSTLLPVYCLHFRGGLAKNVPCQQVRNLVDTTVRTKLSPALCCHIVTKL